MAPRLEFSLEYTPPLDWSFFLRYLGARAAPGVERVADDRYIRTVQVGECAGTFEVSHHPAEPRLVVTIDGDVEAGAAAILRGIRRIFDLDAKLAPICEVLAGDPCLRPLLERSPGIRIPGAWSAFELLVRTIVGQQVTVKAATTIMGRITERLGSRRGAPDGSGPNLLFPSPKAIAQGDLHAIGMPSKRTLALQNVARAIAEGAIRFSETGDSAAEMKKALLGQPGIGPWTVEYFALRALRESDAWPETDLILRRAVERSGSLPSRWRPYRGYAAMHLWNDASRASLTEQAK